MRVEAMPVRAECPEPARWSAPDDWASEAEVSRFLGDLVELVKPDLVIETGSYHGDTSREIGGALASLQRGQLVCLELDPSRAAQTAARCLTLPVEVIEGPSLAYQPSAPIDLLFLDSDFPIRMTELRYFHQWASPRCVVVLHDSVETAYPGWDLMGRAMTAVVDEGLVWPWLHLPTPRGVGLTRYRR
jgi:predicted O-methyltransferase YrrM